MGRSVATTPGRHAAVVAVGGTGATLDALTATDGGVEVTLTQVVAAENLPGIVSKIKPGDLAIVRIESWGGWTAAPPPTR